MNFSKLLVFKESIPTHQIKEKPSGSLHFFFSDRPLGQDCPRTKVKGHLFWFPDGISGNPGLIIEYLLLTRDFASYTIINPGLTWYITHIP